MLYLTLKILNSSFYLLISRAFGSSDSINVLLCGQIHRRNELSVIGSRSTAKWRKILNAYHFHCKILAQAIWIKGHLKKFPEPFTD